MKTKLVRYMVFCCIFSAGIILLYHTGDYFPGVRAEKKQAECEEAEYEQTEYEIPRVEAGIQIYLTENNKNAARQAFCRQVESIRTEPAMAVRQADTSGIIISSEDYDCLLKIVESEAGVCDQKGKILVANVVLNRMNSRYFPDTVEEVVYQDNQFSPVENGSIDRVTVSEDTKKAVSLALSGTDYSHGALFFAARSLADEDNMDWFDKSLSYLFEHDGHEFFTLKQDTDE